MKRNFIGVKKSTRRGSSLIEVIVATGIVALVMTAIVAAITVSIRNAAFAKASTLGTKFSQEGMEFFRRQLNILGWESFVSTLQTDGSSITYCLDTLPANATAFAALPNAVCAANEFVDARNIFQRFAEISVDNSSGQAVITVTVRVTWQDGELQRSSHLVQVFRQREN